MDVTETAETTETAEALDENVRIGRRLREIRSSRDLSLAEVAAATGVSASFLSHVEKGKGDISFGRLRKLIGFYDVTLVDLVGTTHPANPQVIRAHEMRRIRSYKGITVFLLAPSMDKSYMPLLCRFEKGAQTIVEDFVPFEGEEFVHLIRGSIEITLANGKTIQLDKGDSAYLNRQVPREFRNVSRGTSETIAYVPPF